MKFKYILIFILAMGLIILAILFKEINNRYFSNTIKPENRQNAIETALKWGGLTALPENARVISIHQKGSMFTREFIVEFICKPEELENWITKSKGLKDLIPLKNDDGWFIYQVNGFEGSIGGKVTIDKSKSKVIIDMSWS